MRLFDLSRRATKRTTSTARLAGLPFSSRSSATSIAPTSAPGQNQTSPHRRFSSKNDSRTGWAAGGGNDEESKEEGNPVSNLSGASSVASFTSVGSDQLVGNELTTKMRLIRTKQALHRVKKMRESGWSESQSESQSEVSSEEVLSPATPIALPVVVASRRPSAPPVSPARAPILRPVEPPPHPRPPRPPPDPPPCDQ